MTTTAGRAALVNAAHDGTAPLTIAEIGLTAAVFTPSEDMTNLPEEFKRLQTISGEVVAADTIHVTIRDDGTDTYTVRGIGYWLSNGVLLGVYGQPEPILEKSAQSMLLLSADTIFTTINVAALTFGNANFTNPPASTERQGVVALATAVETVAGIDSVRAVTPAALTPALAHTIATHKAEADPHTQYLTPERGNKLYFRTLAAYTNSDTDCDTLMETGVREVSVANDRGMLAHTHLPSGCEGYGTLMTVVGGAFIRQVYSDGGLAQRTWERTGYLNEAPPFKGRPWKLAWDTVTFDPASKQNTLGFSPVQQGTGIQQNPNIVKIGWAKNSLKATVDATDLGDFVFQNRLNADLAHYLPLTGGNVDALAIAGKRALTQGQNGTLPDGGTPIIADINTPPMGWATYTLEATANRPSAYGQVFTSSLNGSIAPGGGNWLMQKAHTTDNQILTRVNINGWTAWIEAWTGQNFNPGDKVSGSGGIRLQWEGRSGNPAWVHGGDDNPADCALYNPAGFSVNYATTASYAHQLAGPGVQENTIGSYRLNKNHTSSEVGVGTWELRGAAYDYGSGGDGNIGTRISLWQRVG
ncbi:hypothetical protein [Glaciimonas sp. PCH181]|uniref:hypothetical protein n=1 Tax=Glaciimonas sp. PCH181 TaxID=2133943 RepID=UPI000D333FE0|nr:hypothetical protein [Glaciimonas sp. PCH181]PUA16829.1 hypothetical protein C7W93_22880 [Glaciimonas sp. PCH181]